MPRHPYRQRAPERSREERRRRRLRLEELAIPLVFLGLGALLVLPTLIGSQVTVRGGGVGVLAVVFGAWSFGEAWKLRHPEDVPGE